MRIRADERRPGGLLTATPGRSGSERRERLQVFGGLIAIAAVAVVVVIAISGGSSAPVTLQSGGRLASTERAVQTLLAGIPQSGTVLGDPRAKVTVIYYGDLECSVCRAFTLEVFPTFVRQEVRTGRANVDYRSLCTATCGPGLSAQAAESLFTDQQVAAYAAGNQNRFWNYAELFYHQQGPEGSGYVTEHYLDTLARESGVSIGRWQADRTNPILAERVSADQTAAAHARVNSTPTLIVQGPGGSRTVNGSYGPYDFPGPQALAAAVKAVS